MQFEFPSIYPITDTAISGLTTLEQVKRLTAGGAAFVQIRDKNASSREFFESAKDCVEFARENRVRIIVNDRADIAMATGADGVHVGQEDLSPTHIRQLLGDAAIIGISTHTLEQAEAAVKMPVDYIAFGPVFPTSTKENPDPVVGLQKLRDVKEIVGRIPLIAIGGINEANVRQVFEAGGDSAAMIGGVLLPANEMTSTVANLLSIKTR